jgi:hypothetical protein
LWLADIEDACQRTATDAEHRAVRYGGNIVEIDPAGQRPEPATSSGPLVAGDLWTRVAARLETKVRQTRGGPPAWLRIDDIGMMFDLTDWSTSPLPERLAQLEHSINVALAGAPPTCGMSSSAAATTRPTRRGTGWPKARSPCADHCRGTDSG